MDSKKLGELREYYDNNEVPMDTATGHWEPADDVAPAVVSQGEGLGESGEGSPACGEGSREGG